jgi:ketosteroid isomerase-like protein
MSNTSPFAQILQQWQDLANKGNAAGVAALYTADAVGVFTEGIQRGQTAIQNDLDAQFKNGWTNIKLTDDEDHPLGNNWAWSVGEWSSTFSGSPVSGYWSVLWVQQGGAWKIQQQTTVTIPPQ